MLNINIDLVFNQLQARKDYAFNLYAVLYFFIFKVLRLAQNFKN